MKNVHDNKAAYFADRIRQRIGSHIRQLVLFGSRARGDARDGSDYDFLLVLDHKNDMVVREIRNVEVDFLNRFDTLSACLIYDEAAWEKRQGFPIGMNIAREGVAL